MARNSAANLVGLAALGALGYKMLQNKKGDVTPGAPVEDKVGNRTEASGAVPSGDLGGFNQANYNSGPARPGPGDAAVAEYVQNAPRVTPVKAAVPKAAAPKAAASVGGPDERYMEGAAAPKSSPKSSSGAVPDMSQYKPRYTPPGRAPKFNAGARYPTTSFTREDVLRSTEPEYSSRMKKGGAVKKMASGGVTRSSASKRADGIATKGKTRGKMY